MNDRELLIWIHERLEHVHDEHNLLDYMYKLRAIISTIPENQNTSLLEGETSLEELKEKLQK